MADMLSKLSIDRAGQSPVGRAVCWFRGNHHDLVPELAPSEFVVVTSLCLTCGVQTHLLPLGDCLACDHPLASHYRLVDNSWPEEAPCDCGCARPT